MPYNQVTRGCQKALAREGLKKIIKRKEEKKERK